MCDIMHISRRSARVLTGQPKVMLLPQHSVTSENTVLPFSVDTRFGPGVPICSVERSTCEHG